MCTNQANLVAVFTTVLTYVAALVPGDRGMGTPSADCGHNLPPPRDPKDKDLPSRTPSPTPQSAGGPLPKLLAHDRNGTALAVRATAGRPLCGAEVPKRDLQQRGHSQLPAASATGAEAAELTQAPFSCENEFGESSSTSSGAMPADVPRSGVVGAQNAAESRHFAVASVVARLSTCGSWTEKRRIF